MNVNETINSLGEELSKLFQKVESLKQENVMLKTKNQELEDQLKFSSNEQGNAGDKLAHFVEKIKIINTDSSDKSKEQVDSYKEENIREINPDSDLI